jgi:hypothetical protein
MSAAATWELHVDTPGPEELEIRRGLVATHLAAGALMLTGLLHAASVLQALLFGWQTVPVMLAEATFAFLAVVHLAIGARAYDGSPIASGLGAATAFGGAGFAALWFVWLFLSGVFGLLPMVVVAGSGATGLLALASIPFALRVVAARQRLLAD